MFMQCVVSLLSFSVPLHLYKVSTVEFNEHLELKPVTVIICKIRIHTLKVTCSSEHIKPCPHVHRYF